MRAALKQARRRVGFAGVARGRAGSAPRHSLPGAVWRYISRCSAPQRRGVCAAAQSSSPWRRVAAPDEDGVPRGARAWPGVGDQAPAWQMGRLEELLSGRRESRPRCATSGQPVRAASRYPIQPSATGSRCSRRLPPWAAPTPGLRRRREGGVSQASKGRQAAQEPSLPGPLNATT